MNTIQATTNHSYPERESLYNYPNRSVMYRRDWRTALRTPPTYRIGNRTLRINSHFAMLIVCVVALFVLFCYVTIDYSSSSADLTASKTYARSDGLTAGITDTEQSHYDEADYNATYPLTSPIVTHSGLATYRIAMVADLDTNAKHNKPDGKNVWRSYLKKGYLSLSAASDQLRIKWDTEEPLLLESGFALNDRGMELSELVTYNGKLLTFDDRTGLIYQLVNGKVIPWIILLDGNGNNAKGFKAEWATVKNHKLYVGSMGKEWTTAAGEFQNENPMFVKEITRSGEVRSINWSRNYRTMREISLEIVFPGYMIHESGVWSSLHQKWFFLPRRCSKEKYNETRDEYMGCNTLISADEHFSQVQAVSLDSTSVEPTHGFSSFKFIPGTNDRLIVGIKSEELNGRTSTFITAFDIDGRVLMPEERIETEYKYEGIEFI